MGFPPGLQLMLTPQEPVCSFGTDVMHASEFSWGRPKASLYIPSSSRFILMHLLLAAYDNWCNRLFAKKRVLVGATEVGWVELMRLAAGWGEAAWPLPGGCPCWAGWR